MKYSIDYFLEKFYAIPTERWGTGSFKRGNRCCALGHCGTSGAGGQTIEGKALLKLLNDATMINDGISPMSYFPRDYDKLGDNPKERIINALLLKKARIWNKLLSYPCEG